MRNCNGSTGALLVAPLLQIFVRRDLVSISIYELTHVVCVMKMTSYVRSLSE